MTCQMTDQERMLEIMVMVMVKEIEKLTVTEKVEVVEMTPHLGHLHSMGAQNWGLP